MGFWWFMFICDMLVPAMMCVFGLIMARRCPSRINSFFGYRTARSMKNTDTWEFAHRHSGRIFSVVGAAVLIISGIAHIPFYGCDEDRIAFVSLVITMIQLIILFISIVPTEIALKRNFNDDGTRR